MILCLCAPFLVVNLCQNFAGLCSLVSQVQRLSTGGQLASPGPESAQIGSARTKASSTGGNA